MHLITSCVSLLALAVDRSKHTLSTFTRLGIVGLAKCSAAVVAPWVLQDNFLFLLQCLHLPLDLHNHHHTKLEEYMVSNVSHIAAAFVLASTVLAMDMVKQIPSAMQPWLN